MNYYLFKFFFSIILSNGCNLPDARARVPYRSARVNYISVYMYIPHISMGNQQEEKEAYVSHIARILSLGPTDGSNPLPTLRAP